MGLVSTGLFLSPALPKPNNMQQTALITGASSGIGEAFAHVFARNGYRLILVARSTGKLEQIAASLRQRNTEVRVLAADLSIFEQVEQLYRQLQQEGRFVDVLVNNAGFGDFGLFTQTDWNKEAMMIDLNVRSLTQLTKLFLPHMVQKGTGRILNVASTAAFQPGPTMAVYYATKAYVLHFSEAIANELEGTGVQVTCLCPGATESGFQQAAAMEDSRLVKGRKLPTSMEVAEYGYDAMVKGKVVAIHGTRNYLMANSVRFAPRSMVRKLVRFIQDKA